MKNALPDARIRVLLVYQGGGGEGPCCLRSSSAAARGVHRGVGVAAAAVARWTGCRIRGGQKNRSGMRRALAAHASRSRTVNPKKRTHDNTRRKNRKQKKASLRGIQAQEEETFT